MNSLQLLPGPLSCSPPHAAAPHPATPLRPGTIGAHALRSAARPHATPAAAGSIPHHSTAAAAAATATAAESGRRCAAPATGPPAIPRRRPLSLTRTGGQRTHTHTRGQRAARAAPSAAVVGSAAPFPSAVTVLEAAQQGDGNGDGDGGGDGHAQMDLADEGEGAGAGEDRTHMQQAVAAAVGGGKDSDASDAGGAGPAGASAYPGDRTRGAVSRLTSAELRAFLEAGALRAEVVPEVVPEQLPPGQGIIKSLLLMAAEQPLLAVVRLQDRVDERRVADLLKVARRRVRLARPEEVLEHTGFVVGTVPPFGHRRHVRTLVDTAVTRLTHVYGGGGEPDMELSVAVPDLLSYANASIADVAVGSGGAGAAAGDPRVNGAGGGGGGLPLPWPPGSQSVELVGVVAQRRRIAKLLQFVNLVPEQVPNLPPDGQAVYLRKLWRNPDTGSPTEVQLILGKTLERNLGRERAQALMDQVKVGAIVAVTGRVQPHPERRGLMGPTAAGGPAPAPASGTVGNGSLAASSAPAAPDGSTARTEQQQPQQRQRPGVLDVVCHSVTVLHKNKEQLQKALRAARRSHPHPRLLAGASPSTAAELRMLQQLRPDGPPPRAGTEPTESEADAGTDPEEEEEEEEEEAGVEDVAATAGRRATASAPGSGSGWGDGGSRPGSSAATERAEEQERDGSAAGAGRDAGHAERRRGQGGGLDLGPLGGSRLEGQEGGAGAAVAEARPSPADWAAALAGASAASAGWRMPLRPEAVRLVGSAAEMPEVHWEVLGWGAAGQGGGDGDGDGGSGPQSTSSPSSPRPPASPVGRVVALDCEWAPFERHQPKNPVAILQVATRERVYVLDLLSLMAPEDESVQTDDGRTTTSPGRPLSSGALAVSRFLSQLLSSREVVKLGFQLASDLDRLCESYPHLPCFTGPHVVDDAASASQPTHVGRDGASSAQTASGPELASSSGSATGIRSGSGGTDSGSAAVVSSCSTAGCSLCVDVVALARCLRPELGRTPQISLSRLVAMVLGEPLDKTQQVSDWACRPLSAEQVLYAATDAYCLVALYDALMGFHVDAYHSGDLNDAHWASTEKIERAEKILQAVPSALKRLPLGQRNLRCYE